MRISIANLIVQLDQAPAALDSIVADSPYRSFVQSTPFDSSAEPADIIVRMMRGKIEPIESLQPIFDTGEAWQLYQGHDFFYLTFQPHQYKNPLWTAKFDLDFSRVDQTFNVQEGPDWVGTIQKKYINPMQYPLDQILLMQHMAHQQKGLLVHSAGLSLGERGYVFPGISTAGKTTLSRQFMEKGWGELLSDDRMIVRKGANRYHAHGTPWPGDAGVAVNQGVPLSGLFFIHHADHNRLESLQPKEAVERLMPVSSIPWYDKVSVVNLLDFCNDLTSSVPAYDLYFKPTTEVVDFLQSVSPN